MKHAQKYRTYRRAGVAQTRAFCVRRNWRNVRPVLWRRNEIKCAAGSGLGSSKIRQRRSPQEVDRLALARRTEIVEHIVDRGTRQFDTGLGTHHCGVTSGVNPYLAFDKMKPSDAPAIVKDFDRIVQGKQSFAKRGEKPTPKTVLTWPR